MVRNVDNAVVEALCKPKKKSFAQVLAKIPLTRNAGHFEKLGITVVDPFV
jgi:hypothetical protein